MPLTAPIIDAADALLRVLVARERERFAARPATPIRATPFALRDAATLPRRGALDLAGLASDPIGTACRAELRRIGEAIHADDPTLDLDDAAVDIAEVDPTHAGWRSMVLESAWIGIGGRPS